MPTTTPTHSRNLDHESSRQQQFTPTALPISLIDNFYPDPYSGFDRYRDVHLYNLYHLDFQDNLDKMDSEVEPDSREFDKTLNNVFTTVLIDPYKANVITPFHQLKPGRRTSFTKNWTTGLFDYSSGSAFCEHASHENKGACLCTADIYPWTQKYQRQVLNFPMDIGEVTLDGLVNTGGLSGAIPGAELR